jgi:hypothetical protein
MHGMVHRATVGGDRVHNAQILVRHTDRSAFHPPMTGAALAGVSGEHLRRAIWRLGVM